MILNLAAFETLPESLRSSLLFLRGQRDHAAYDLSLTLSSEDCDRWIEDMICYRSANSAYCRLKTRLYNRNYGYQSLEPLELLKKLCLRIARIERERCHIKIYEHELLAA